MVSLTGERLLLRAISEAEAVQVLDYYSRNKKFLSLWEPERTEEFYTLAAQQEQLACDLKEMDEGRLVRTWIFEKDCSGQIIGSIALSNIVRGAFQSCYLGYKLDEKKARQGYMTEALNLMIGYAFKKLQLHRIEANIIPRNQASMKTAEKLGFYQEGLALKYLKINGRWEDHIHMVLRNREMEV